MQYVPICTALFCKTRLQKNLSLKPSKQIQPNWVHKSVCQWQTFFILKSNIHGVQTFLQLYTLFALLNL